MPVISCPWCYCRDCRVTHTSEMYSKARKNGKMVEFCRIKRRRVCRHCKMSFTTVEKYLDPGDLEEPEK